MLKNAIQEVYERFKTALTDDEKNQLISELYNALLPYSKNLVKKFFHQENEELAHDMVVECVMTLDKFAGDCLLSTWFRKMVFHGCVSYWRSHAPHRLVSLEDLTSQEFKRLTDSSVEDLDTKIDIKRLITKVRNKLAPFGEEIVAAVIGAGSLAGAAEALQVNKHKLYRMVARLRRG